MQCSRCQASNREGRRFCAECGAPLAAGCPHCGVRNEPAAKFCGRCGTALTGAGQAPTAAAPERRQLTVMFCELVGSAALAAQLDPEDMREVIQRYHETCAAVIARYEGVVARYQGDGIMVDFGYPRAHENNAEQGVWAGLGIIQAMAGFGAALGLDANPAPAVRIGIATGVVVAGDPIGEGAAEEMAVVGETPNLAARLKSLAQPNTVVIAPSTRRLLGGLFEYRDLGLHPLKGFDKPVRVWQVLGPSRTESRFEAVRGVGLTPLVGREEEVELLLKRWQRVKTGEGQVVLIAGESGIGKSRLIQVLGEHVTAEPHRRLHYQCSPFYRNSALYPFIDQFQRAAGLRREDTPVQKLDKLAALVREFTHQPPANAVPLLAALLSLPTGGRYPPLELNPELQKSRIFATLVRQIQDLAVRQPVLIVFEDVHWIDPSSQELLDLITERIQRARVMLLIAFRSDFAPPWTGQQHVTLLALNRLNRRQCQEMIARVAGPKALPQELIEQIAAKTDGVPLFIEELTKTVLASGLLQEQAERYVLSGPLRPLAIPATLQDSLMARLDRQPSARELAQIGAIIGREFSHELLAAVSGLTEAKLGDALERLRAAEIFSRRGTPPAARYAFRHVLVQDAAYQSILKGRRQRLHARIVQVLEERFREQIEIEPELFAHHYTEAGLNEPAVTCWARAGQRALTRSANAEAVSHLTKGLQLLEALPPSPQRDRQELDLHIALGAAYRAIKGFAATEVERCFSRARALCEPLGDSQPLIEVLRGLYGYRYARAELAEARQLAEQMFRLAQRRQDRLPLILAHYMRGPIMFWQGEFRDARRELETAIGLHRSAPPPGKVLAAQLDPGVNARLHLGWTLWMLGYPEQALATSQQAITEARELSQPYTLAMALAYAGWVRVCCGQPALTQALAQDLRTLTAEHTIAYASACAAYLEGLILLAEDQIQPGLLQVQRAWSEFSVQGAAIARPWVLSAAIAIYVRIGEVAEGWKLLAEAFEAVEQHGERQWEAELHRLEGELRLASSPPRQAEAEESFRTALAIAAGQAAKALELRAATSLARLLRRQGRPEEARQRLGEVYGWFTEGLATADLVAARSLLEELGEEG